MPDTGPDSQKTRAILRLREMILQGRLAPGQRVAEAMLAEQLGLSRTPVRQALPVLAEEGLLIAAGARGFAVRSFTARDTQEAVELRGCLEGMAARALAERGAPRAVLRELQELLAEGDEIFADRIASETTGECYSEVNARFHATIIAAAERPLVAQTLERICRIPFVAPGAIAFDRMPPARRFDTLWYAHRQHHEITAAITAGDGARAEFLFRDHVHAQMRSLNLQILAPQGAAPNSAPQGAGANPRPTRQETA